jgi:hypothetical protein
MGGGKSSGNQTTNVQITPEQRALLQAQTDFLTGTAFPAYKQTVQGAQTAYEQSAPAAYQAATNAMNVAQRSGAQQEIAGGIGLGLGMQGLASLFGQDYKNQQVNAALQAGRESGRELVNEQVAGYGGAGGLGSARAALANRNLASLQEQRQGTVAATTAGQVEQNRALAAQQLSNLGLQGLTNAQQSAVSRVSLAQTPQDVYNKYASVVYGIPQQNTTPNFAGTQGSTTSGSSKGFGITKGS